MQRGVSAYTTWSIELEGVRRKGLPYGEDENWTYSSFCRLKQHSKPDKHKHFKRSSYLQVTIDD